MNAIVSLYDFIKTSASERKYAENTARGLRAAVKLFESYLTDAEKESLDVFEKNLSNIANDIYSKQKNGEFTSKTLIVYRKRIQKVISDYRTYGSDPGKMASWNPRRSTSELKQKGLNATAKNTVKEGSAGQFIDAEYIVQTEPPRRTSAQAL